MKEASSRGRFIYPSTMPSETFSKSRSDFKIIPPQLKACLNKVYTLDSNENYEEFLLELGVKKDVRVNALRSRPSMSLHFQNNCFVLNSLYPEGEAVKVRFRPGERALRSREGGRVIETIFDISKNVLTEKLNVDGFDITIDRVFTKTEMTATMEVNDIKCVRVFSVPKSAHSIDTETSRRSSLFRLMDSFENKEESPTEEEYYAESETLKSADVCY